MIATPLNPERRPLRCRKTNIGKEGAPAAEKDAKEEVGESGRSGKKLACRICQSPITSRGDAIDKDGKHQHTFFNPAGILFEVGCFARAPGCAVTGQPTSEFSWFKGFLWQYASCGCCGAHLGWFFSGARLSFYGLIVARLVEVEEGGD